MRWIKYFLSYRLETPLHIGAPALGNVQRTLYYIPGKTLWGAASALLTRKFVNRPTDHDYEMVGKFVEGYIRFGYLFPKHDGQRLLPKIKNVSYRLGNLSKEEFEYRFLNSDASTAIYPDRLAQHEGTLHETEYIYPKSLDGKSAAPLYFSGYLYLQQDRHLSDINEEALKRATDDDLFDLLGTLFVGANRRIGAGKLILEIKPLPDEDADNNISPKPGTMDLSAQHPYLASHLRCEPNLDKMEYKILGPVQPLVERKWAPLTSGKGGPGQHLTSAEIAWVPGSMIADNELQFGVAAFGRWQVL